MKIIGLGVNNRIGQSGSILGRFKSSAVVAPVVSGTLSSQSLQQGTGVVTYTTSGAFTGAVASWSMTGGAAGITINASTGVVSVDRAVAAVNVFNLVIRATNAAGFAETGFSLTVTASSLVAQNQITQGSVTFPFTGTPRLVGNSFDGAAFIIVPDGGTVTMNSPTPAVSSVTLSSTTYATNGVTVNPLIGKVSSYKHPFDQRLNTEYSAVNLATFPRVLNVGDIVVKAISNPTLTEANRRQGVIDEYAVCHVISESQYAAMPTTMDRMLSPAPFSWAGRASKTWRQVDMDALFALRPSLPLAGVSGMPDVTTIVNRFNRFNLGLNATMETAESGYEGHCLNMYGSPTGGNYGASLTEAIRIVSLAFLGDTARATIEPAIRRFVAIGSWWFDQEEGKGSPLDGDGGHWQFHFHHMIYGLLATGRSARVADISTISPQNQLSQSFIMDAPRIAQLAPHADPTKPFTYRRRTVSAIGATTITVNIPESLYHINFYGLECRKFSDNTLIGYASTATSSGGASTYVVQLDRAVSGLSVSDEVYFPAPADWFKVGSPAWSITDGVIGVGFANWSPSPQATYYGLNYWAGEALLIRGLGLYSPQFEAMEKLVKHQAYETLPSSMLTASSGALPPPSPFPTVTFNGYQVGHGQYVKNFWDTHAADMGLGNVINPVIGLLTQSQTAYILNNGAFYRTIPQPIGAGVAGNVTTYLDNDTGGGPVKYEVTTATVSAGQVNPTVAAWGVFWDRVMPGTHFNIVDLAVPGTGRLSIAQDGHADNRWPGFSAMIALARTDHDDLDAVIDIWQGNDSTTAKTFATEWAPFYTGQRSNGSSYTVGTANPDSVVNSGQVLNHILWDIEADPALAGRGVFKQGRTKLYFTGWPTYSGSVAFPAELRNSSTQSNGAAAISYPSHFDMPARSKIDEFIANYPSFTGEYIGMTHAANMLGGVHASTTDPEGQILIGWGIAVAALKVAGYDVAQPIITGIEAASNGSYADVLVSLPNGGNLTTYEALRSLSPAATEPPHYQPVMGFEIRRLADADSARRPVYKTTETGYPVNYRGTVVIQSAGTGTGAARVGRIRITPTTPFANGDMIYFGRGDASMMLQNPRDVDAKLYRRQPLENIAAFYDAAATYPCPGIWVKPQPPVMTVSGVGGADVVAPILSSVTAAKTDTTGTLSWSTDEANGTAYWLVDTNATRTSAQVITGGGSGSGSSAVTSTGSQPSFVATGLSVSTAYYFHLVHVDASGNASIVSNTPFTTDAGAAASFFTALGGPYFVGQTNLPTTSQITFSMRIKPSATGATRYLINYDGTSITADVTTSGFLRVGVEDGAGAVVRSGAGSTGVSISNGVWTNLVIAIDLAAATLKIRKDGTLTNISMTAAGNTNFQTGQRGSFLATKTGANQFVAEVEYIKVWYSAEADGSEPVAAPFATIAGNAAAVNGITTPFLQSGNPAT
jgi:hypothetical protein